MLIHVEESKSWMVVKEDVCMQATVQYGVQLIRNRAAIFLRCCYHLVRYKAFVS